MLQWHRRAQQVYVLLYSLSIPTDPVSSRRASAATSTTWTVAPATASGTTLVAIEAMIAALTPAQTNAASASAWLDSCRDHCNGALACMGHKMRTVHQDSACVKKVAGMKRINRRMNDEVHAEQKPQDASSWIRQERHDDTAWT